MDLGDIVLGLTQVTLGSEPNVSSSDVLGLDLDGTCTKVPDCPDSDNSGSCHARTRVPVDGRACRDNALVSALSAANQISEIGRRFGLSEEALNCGLRAGAFNVLIRIHGYNGTADDPNVQIDWYSAVPYKSDGTWDCEGPDAPMESKWNVSTLWRVDEADLKAPQKATTFALSDSRYSDREAYVRDGYLVSRMPDGATLRLNGGFSHYRAFAVPTGGAYWLGHLAKLQGDTWRMTHGLWAGRIHLDDLQRVVRQTGSCEGEASELTYSLLLQSLNENADVLAGGESDPSRTCDALSFGIGFEAMQASPFGSQGVFDRVLECCAPGRTNAQCTAACGDGVVSGDEKCDTAIEVGRAGACPTACSSSETCVTRVLSGAGCSVECVPKPITEVGAKDGCCPKGANMTADSDCVPQCGNGVIDTGETCDPPSSCRPCVPLNGCYVAAPSGNAAGCSLRCEQVKISVCADGDGCCPEGCNRANDSDCSATCGNNTLDDKEACEMGSNRTCPASCDDRDPCTIDASTGSAATCSLICTHRRITAPSDGDGCCPDGASANVDNDCERRCGNRVVETGEQCDDGNDVAGDGCFECKTEDAGLICLMKQGNPDDACSRCTCSKCAGEALNCYAGESDSDSKLCRDMVNCAYESKCGNPDCFCGNVSLFGCLGGAANGPCKQRTQDAAKSDSLLDIDVRGTDLNYPLGRANAVFTCRERSCASECGVR